MISFIITSMLQLILGSILVVFVAVVATLVLVGYPRPWWTHNTFDVDEYIADDLIPRINRNVDVLMALKHAAADSGQGHSVHTMTIANSGAISFETPNQATRVSITATRAAHDLLVRACEGLSDLSTGIYASSDFTSGLADLGDIASVRNSRPHAYNRLITQAAEACGSLAEDICGTYAGLLLLISVDDMRNLQAGHINMGLAELARAYVRKADSSEDPYIAHIGHCAKAGLSGVEEHRVVSERISGAVLALTDLGYIYNVVVPQVRSMRHARRAQGFASVFWVFFDSYRVQWFAKQDELMRRFKDKKGSLREDTYTRVFDEFITSLKKSIMS
jgi:hypothetical protein